MGCLWPSSKQRRPEPKKITAANAARPWPAVNGANGYQNAGRPTAGAAAAAAAAAGRQDVSSSGSDSDAAEDKVPDMLSERLSAFPENCRRFKYAELEVATRRPGVTSGPGWDSSCVVGEGGFGKVYRGVLADGSLVAIKRLDRLGMQGDKEFGMEVSMLASLRHANIITLRGVCVEGDHRCMLSDLCANGSLRGQLDLREKGLGWAARVNVALGAALGLAYLHDQAEPPVVHRDFKTSNILVDEHCNARVADFGLARRMKSRGGAGCHEPLAPECTVVMGTFGYVAPEYARTGTLNEKSDVYAFGVVLLEVLTGAEVVDPQRPLANRNLVDWLYSRLHDIAQVKEVLDSVLGELPDAELATFCELAAACLQQDGFKRPRMSQVAAVLRQIADCHHGDMVGPAPETPPQSDSGRQPANVTPTSSGEEGLHLHHHHPAVTIPGAPSDTGAMRSLSHEATIVVLDGDHRSRESAAIRDPFAASFAGFTPTMRLPEQRGFSNNGGGDNPFASLAQQYPPPQQQMHQPLGADGGQLNVFSHLGPAAEAGPSHQRRGSFSESLDVLAQKLGLSGPMGPAGRPQQLPGQGPLFQNASNTSSQDSQGTELTVTNMAWDGQHPNQTPAQAVAAAAASSAAGGLQRRNSPTRPAAGKPTLAFGRPVPPPPPGRRVSPTGRASRPPLPPPAAAARPHSPPLRPQPQQQLAQQQLLPVVPQANPAYGLGPLPMQNGSGGGGGGGMASPTAAARQQQQALAAPQPQNQQQQQYQQQQQSPIYAAPPYAAPPVTTQPVPQLRIPQAVPTQQYQQYAQQGGYAQPQLPAYAVQQGLHAQQQQLWGQQPQMVAGWSPRVQQLPSPSSPPWLRPQRQEPPPPTTAPSNPFHSTEPCMVCGQESREWHLAPCGHAIGCKPCVLKIARVGSPCLICGVGATGMLHQRFVHASPPPAPPMPYA